MSSTVKELRAAVRAATPSGVEVLTRPVRQAVDQIRHRGDDVDCPLCGSHWSSFSKFNGREHARCPRCHSLERHRKLWLFLTAQTDLMTVAQRVLHVAPEPYLRDKLSRVHGEGYVYGDIADPQHRLDVTDLQFPDNSFDVAICSHVFEHVPDDMKAVSEFYRVLKPGTWAILDAPVEPKLEHTYEDPTITNPAERRRHFGQWDHVRKYSPGDYATLLRSAGFELEVVQFQGPPGASSRYGLRPDADPIYMCRKLRT